jgi:hypothetical protein
MTRIVMDAVLRAKLHNLSETLELCDEDGRVLAQVTPVEDLSEYEPCEPPISEEELQRREKSNKWFSTPEVIAHLKCLE